jgi:tRNA(fMet)-specific endonuclease VapC
MKYLLDTSTCIFFLRGRLNLDEIIREKGKENCSISEITIAELRFGAENSQDPINSNIAVDNFLNGITIIPIISSLRLYAKEKVRLRKQGKPINDEFDLLIGVTAVQNKMKLITDNIKDFENIKDIEIENWFIRK